MSLDLVSTQVNGDGDHPANILPFSNHIFDCFYPAPDAVIKRIQESMPIPTSMVDALTYAVGYIDQGATVSRSMEHNHAILEKRYQAATERICSDLVELEKLRAQTELQISQITELEDNLAVQTRYNQRLQHGLNKLRSGEGDSEGPELMLTSEKLQRATKQVSSFKEKYSLAHKENVATKAKLAVESKHCANLMEYKTKIETSLANQAEELLCLQKKLAQAAVDFAEATHHIDVDGHIIAGIQDEREALKRALFELKQEFENHKIECAAALRAVKVELDDTRVKLQIVEEEKDALAEAHRNCEAKLKASEDARRAIEEEHRNCAANLLAAEEKLAKAQAELEEVKTPVLENTVSLQNPIAIVGNLRGAERKVDDEFFPVPTLPFAVTIFDHSSTNLFVTDNGMLCFDEPAKSPASVRLGQRLPFREGVPAYSLFPFWTDLMLAEGKPHGIFYEIAGTEGQRTLTIEWYVTRYQHEDQYFQFNVSLEEAKPNIVTFKYYIALDQGQQCTVGVQGPSSSMMFSSDEPKVVPGLKIVFNTKTNKMTPSTFILG